MNRHGRLGQKDAESTCPRAFQLQPRDGREAVIVEAEFSANCDAGRLVGMIVVFRDVTEKRRAERQNRQLQKMSGLTLMATGLGRELAESQNQMDASLKHLIEQSRGSTRSLLWDIFERSAHQQTVIQQLITLGKMDAGQTRLLDLNAFPGSIEEQSKDAWIAAIAETETAAWRSADRNGSQVPAGEYPQADRRCTPRDG